MRRVFWTAHTTNVEVLMRIGQRIVLSLRKTAEMFGKKDCKM